VVAIARILEMLPTGYTGNLKSSTLLQSILNKKRQTFPADPFADAQARATQLSQPYLDLLTKQQAQAEQSARDVAAQNQRDLGSVYDQQRPMIDKSYGEAIASNAAIEDAVSKHLSGAGTEATTDLAKQLSQIGGPGADAEVAKLAETYKGAGGAEYATGTSDIQNLVSNKAAAKNLLGKQQIAETYQVGKDLSAAITSIAKEYGVQKADVLKALPSQIADIYSMTQDAAKQTESTREYNKEFNYRSSQDLQDRVDARHKLALETKLTMQQTMSESDYKIWAKKFDAHQKELDRQSRQQIAAASRAASANSKVANIDLTGPSNRKYITVPDANGNPTLVENPNYVPPVKKSPSSSSSDTVDTAGSAKRNRAYDAALSAVFNKNTGRVRETVAYGQDSNMKALKLINAALKGMGVAPYSKAGNQIRQSIWGFLDGKPAGNPGGGVGKFVDPRKDDPRFKKRKKK
jgi:hypothetical protein